MEKKTVLVTGLCRTLLGEGYDVRAFVRRSSDLSHLRPHSALHLAYGDVTDLPSLLSASVGCHMVFHAAALVETWLPDPSAFLSVSPSQQVNVGGLKNVLQVFRETETIEKIIYTSSFFALGPTDGYVADEKQMHPGKFFCTEYEKSKTIADHIALQAAGDGITIILLYPSVVYGSGKLTAGNIVARIKLIQRCIWLHGQWK